MNRSAREHLAKAKDYLAKGERFYHQAATEILAAKNADPKLTQAEIGKAFDMSLSSLDALLYWHETGSSRSGGNLPRSEPVGAVATRHARSVLSKAPLEQIEQIISTLPPSRQRAIGAATRDAYFTKRQEFEEREASLTPADRKARDAAADESTKPIRDAVGGFRALGIVGHLEQATEELRELVGDDSVNARLLRQIERAHDEWCTELEVARGMAGLEAR